jgi:Concanavalin A-like lectin/glucanases superfamily
MRKLLPLLILIAAALASCTKINEPVPVTLKAILLGKDTLTMYVGDVKQIDYTLTPVDFSAKSLIFSSSDSTVISAKSTGLLTAKKPGVAVITVTNPGNTISVNCLVSVLAKPIIPKVDSLKVGLIAYYPFNFDSAVDSSGNGNDGTIFNITSIPDRFGNPNTAYYFNGVNSYIQVKDNLALRLNNTDFTLNAWVKLDLYNDSYTSSIISKRITGANNGWLWGVTGYSNGPAGAAFYGPGGGSTNAFGNKIMSIATWHMVTCVYSLSKMQLSIYVDGVLDNVTTGILTANASISTMLYIGSDSPGLNDNGYFFQGAIDDIRIYGRMLKPSDINRLYSLTY